MSTRYILQIRKVPHEDFTLPDDSFELASLDDLTDTNRKHYYEEILPNTEAIFATGPVSSDTIAKALKLKVIVVNGAGYDDIDIKAASALHIPVYNIPDVTARATAEYALTLMLCTARRAAEMNLRLRDVPGGDKSLFRCGMNPGFTLEGKTLGIVGFGRIGQQLARMVRPLKMDVVYYQRHPLDIPDPTIRMLPFRELLAVSDVVSIHCPLNEDSCHLFNEDAFRRMKQNAILINTARGAVVDQEQLIRFLKAGRLAGAALDVFPNEPEIMPELLEMDNVVLSPHFGTNTFETRAAMAERMSDIVRAVIGGDPTVPGNLVNPEALRA